MSDVGQTAQRQASQACAGLRISTPAGRFNCNTFEWVYDQNALGLVKIVTWTEADGSTGELIASSRKPYWQLHDNDDLSERKDLKND